MRGSHASGGSDDGREAAGDCSGLLAAHWRELGVTLEMLVGFVEQVSVDLGASPYIAD
jgi:hypothetical protein